MENDGKKKKHNFREMTDEELMSLTGGGNFVSTESEFAIDTEKAIVTPLYGIKPRPPILKYGIYPLYGIKPPVPLYGIKPITES